MNYNDLPILETEFLLLRQIAESDSNLIVRWCNNVHVEKNFLYRGDFTAETHRVWLREKVFTGEVVQYIIEVKCGGRFVPVGSVYLRDIDYENSSAEFGIFIGEDFARGKGIGTEAAKIMLDYGHNQLGLHRIFLRLIAENIGAYKSYRKAGFVTEGIFRDMRKIDGKFVDIMFMSSIQNTGGYNFRGDLCTLSYREVACK